MTELETLERAKMYMEKLTNGINPIDGSTIPDEDVVNNVRLSRCFFYVADVLRQVIDNSGVTAQKKAKKEPFALPVEKRSGFAFSDVPITISEIVKRINDLVANENMNRLTISMVTDWLVSINILVNEMNAEGKIAKRPSPQGRSLGIGVENRTSINGPYSVVVYNREAQRFIIDNLDAALDAYRAKTENQGQPWTLEHDQCLLDLHQKGVPAGEIAVTLKRNSGAVRARLKKLGITE
ncbi:MAG: hypothetical protein E7436_03710 [Ruminococcaceae bacterium]|nr:hypothetical protein [Oscillospiraceae bacterium]MBE6974578.1 hypothetical protein [Oscillospiraceae bacterium]